MNNFREKFIRNENGVGKFYFEIHIKSDGPGKKDVPNRDKILDPIFN